MQLRTMADSVSASALPAGLPAYAGYVDGVWPSFAAICRRFGHVAHCVSITVRGGDARIADCEAGDLTAEHGARWLAARVPRRARHGVVPRPYVTPARVPQWRPGLYFPLSWHAELVEFLAAFDLDPAGYVLWAAHWTSVPPVLLPPGIDAVQHRSDVAANVDYSVIGPRFTTADRAVAA